MTARSRMLFASPTYGVFLLVTYVVFWALRRRPFLRPLFLMLASYVFYFVGTFDAAKEQDVPFGPLGWTILCVAIIFCGSTLDFWIGKTLDRTESPRKRKALLLCSIVYYLGVLSIFKYFNFATESVATVLGWAGVHVEPAHLRLVLPFGISFFTFETMSYTIDVYRREIPAATRYLDYLLFVCFFPHLVAGPIVRPKSMLPQLAAEPVASDAMKAEGLFLIATGLLKKIVIGDTLGLNLVNRVFDNPERYSSLETLVGVYAYAIKIYADFSGYSDVAIGSAKLFGYELPRNFDAPYTSADLQEFWRRWHISLSTWLRDYLYVTLGGNRGGTWATYRNLLLTMVLGGLWHGASWNFVIWGALHGGALAVNRAWQRRHHVKRPVEPIGADMVAKATALGGAEIQRAPVVWTPRRVLSVFTTFHFVCFAWIFFRAPSFLHATALLSRFGKLSFASPNLSARVVGVLVLGMVTHFIGPSRAFSKLKDLFVRAPAVAQGVALAVCAWVLHFAAAAKAEPFIYGQF
ncbi:MAG: MBOAT family protein [Labilithrix sp.]|nr:MBOAT family protein [Labilithrix sp.]MCW5810153.1 MBOAT family protein [Labilithrix sp.]